MQPTPSRRIAGGLVALAMLIGAGTLWVSSRWPAPADDGDARAPEVAEATANPVASVPVRSTADAGTSAATPSYARSSIDGTAPPAASASSAAIPPAPLPPADTPLAQVIDELTRRARGGDAAAACRLGFELLRCQNAGLVALQREVLGDGLVRSASRTSGRDAQQNTELIIDVLARSDLMLERANAVCAGVDVRAHETPLYWLRQAASAGEATSRTALLRHIDPINQGQTLANLNQLARFRDQAAGWITEEIARGADVVEDTAMQLGQVLQYGLLAEVLSNHPAVAHALFQLYDRKHSAQQAPAAAQRRALIQAHLPPADAAIRAEATSLVARYDAARAARHSAARAAPHQPSPPFGLMPFDPAASAATCGALDAPAARRP